MPRRAAADAAATRAAILAAARRSFGRDGFASASLASIAAEAGVTRGAVHHHFTDKRALFIEVFEVLERQLNDAVVDAARSAPPERRMRAGVEALFEFCRRDDYRRIALSDAPAVLGLLRWYEVDRRAGMDTMRRGVQALADSGGLDARLIEPLTVLLFGALTEAAVVLGSGAADVDVGGVLEAFELLVAGLTSDRRAVGARSGDDDRRGAVDERSL